MEKKWLKAPALLLMDIQKGFDNVEYFGGERNNLTAEHNAALLLEFWRHNKWPLFHIRHDSVHPESPLAPGQPGNEHKEEVKPLPGEPVIAKNVNSAFIGTDLKAKLDAAGIRNIVIVGLTTQHCVSTTARMAGNFGYDPIVVADAVAAFRSKGLDGKVIPAQLVHEVSLATLNGEFAEILMTEELLRSELMNKLMNKPIDFFSMRNVTKRIIAFNESRLPKMRPLKYRLMQENAFRFFRGTCHLFYEDLAAAAAFSPGPLGWICGDLHLENFGSYRSDNNQVYFDLNDFDEAFLAPVTWEVVRLVSSIFVGFESLGIEARRAEKMAALFLKSYAATLTTGKADYVEAAMAKGIICDFLTRVSKRKQRIILEKKANLRKKRVQITTDSPKHFKLTRATKQALMEHVTAWLKVDEHSPYNYKVVDGVFRLAGTGSIGVERYAFLLKSLNDTGFKYILLDMKEAVPSSLAPYTFSPQPAWHSEADRVISAQRRMQNRCLALLSTSTFRGKSFIMQEMQPAKDSINFRLLRDRYRDMYSVIDSMAMLTASAQLRSSGQDGSATTDELKAFGGQEGWQEAVLTYAAQYARRNQEYYEGFVDDAGQNGLADEAEEIEEEGEVAV